MNGIATGAAFAAIVVVALAGCGKNQGHADSNAAGGTSSAAVTANATTPGSTTAAAPSTASIRKATQAIDTDAISANESSTKNWLAYGLGYSSTRFSRLDQIDTDNVGKLGLAWSYNLQSTHHGVEVTPVVVDGIMYVTAPWNVVSAINATTGKQLWRYDPKVPRDIAYKGCCDVTNRGVAVYKGKVYEGTYDGRLIALDAATGKLLWSTDTLPAGQHNYTITGAPLVANGKVVIGNGGAEYVGVRGYVSAYDADTGKLDWRWYTVPGDPAKGYQDKALKKAAASWDPKTKYWLHGGGGTVWQSFSYDPKLGLLYFGTGNADPWNPSVRGGRQWSGLYTDSIVALNLKTGKYVWSYQTTPADFSDYDSDQDMILATLKIDGKDMPVIMNANKNGFFYVLNRKTGQFISANNFVPQNWAKGYTDEGKPILTDLTQNGKPFTSIPGPFGGHNWQAMSYSPETGLVYIPAQLVPVVLAPMLADNGTSGSVGGLMAGNGWNLGYNMIASDTPTPFGRLVAWNPVTQKEVWHAQYPAPWNGGTLATAGNLVFQATATGDFIAYDATTGKKLWQAPLGQGAIAAPMTYSVDGKQYVTIAVGWGGVAGESFRATDHQNPGTVFTFVLNGNAEPPKFNAYAMQPLLSGIQYDPADVEAGTTLYVRHCAVCHGVPGAATGGSVPNLGYVGKGVIENLDRFVFNGPFVSNGMPDFTGKFTKADADKIKAFIQASADKVRQQRAEQSAKQTGQ